MTHDVTDARPARTPPAPTPAQRYAGAADLLGMEQRSQQLAIVEAVTTPGPAVLALEAPTGTGKSLGALLGAAVRVLDHPGERVAVATFTNVLREQYLLDLARARRAFPRVRFATVAGAGTYTCRNRARGARLGIPAHLRPALDRFLAQPPGATLEIAALEVSALERYVRVDAEECSLDERCTREGECGLRVARVAAFEADVVVTNHALLAVNARAGGAVIGSFAAAVVDEVHRLGEALRSAGSVSISSKALGRGRTLLDDGEAARLDRLLAALGDLAPRGEKFTSPDGGGWTFEDFAQPFDPAPLRRRVGVCATDSRVSQTRVRAQAREHLDDEHLGDPGESPRCPRCRELRRDDRRAQEHADVLDALAEWLEVCSPPVRGQVRDLVGTLRHYRTGWRAAPSAYLTLTPVTTDALAEALTETIGVLVCISATVGCTSDPAYALTEAGLAAHLSAPVTRLPPAFDYPVQMVARFDRRARPERERLLDALTLSGGRALVLTRSHRRKDEVAAAIASMTTGEPRVLTQPPVEEAATRGAAVRAFAADETSVLVGTRSYFEGIDVPGDALRHVVIADRPFVAYGPLQRQLEVNLAAQGRSWREVHYAPQVEMTLEQIAGRLIRSRADFGWVTYLDADPGDAAWFERRFDAALARFGPVRCDVVR